VRLQDKTRQIAGEKSPSANFLGVFMKHSILSDLRVDSRLVIPTAEAAIHLNRTQQTLRLWASSGSGPIQPKKINGRLAWRIDEILNLIEVSS
jgi:hypothetical protein